MTDIEKIEARLERIAATIAAQTIVIKELTDELDLTSPGTSERIAATLRATVCKNPDLAAESNKQLAFLASVLTRTSAS